MEQLFGSDNFDIVPHAIALAIAYALAFPLGWNREQEERSAGLRTFPLVAVACCGMVQASEALVAEHPEGMARIIEGLLVGMGFIGGGAILRVQNSVRGTATAAGIWVTGAMGIAVGLGSYDVALMLSLITFVTLQLLDPLKEIAQEDGQAEADNSKAAARPVRKARPKARKPSSGRG
jgi:putative Mg2+ transporter-C (MgtC) family protein